jgi:hypothetical protein
MGAGGIEEVCMVRWFLQLRLVRGVAFLEASVGRSATLNFGR